MAGQNLPEMAWDLLGLSGSSKTMGELSMLKETGPSAPVSYWSYRKTGADTMPLKEEIRIAVIDDDEDDYIIINDYIKGISRETFCC
jgi:hypothetical protein